MSGSGSNASGVRRRSLAIGGYAVSVVFLGIGVTSAWLSASRYGEARSFDMQVEVVPQIRRRIHRIAPEHNPLVKARELRSSAGRHLTVFITTTILAVAGLAGSGYLLRRTPSGEGIAKLPERIGFPRWLPWEPVLAGSVAVVFGMGPLSALLPDPEGIYEVTRVEVGIAKADFEGRYKLAPGSQPKLFMVVRHNGKVLVNTGRRRRLAEAYSATFGSSFRVNWRHEDQIVYEVRDDDFIGSKVLMRGGGAKSGVFPLKGTYRSRAGSTITFTTTYVGE